MSGDAIQMVESFWALMATNDFRSVGSLLANDFILDWPQSGERIRGRENYADDRTTDRLYRMLTARAASKTSTVREIIDWSIINALPQRASTGTSVGEKAVLVLKAMKR